MEERESATEQLMYLDVKGIHKEINTLRTGDADLRLYITTVQDG